MYAWCQDMPGVSAEDYAEPMANLGGTEKEAAGLVVHVAGPVAGGFGLSTFGSQRTPPTGSTATSFNRQ